ncbi:hypothetical protein [Exiguobacterium sp. SH0S2]|uniref:hypothetical protein n=1 Tax=Exiguobacterium sp. SH0S2 TaxID=2510950 RepID=UPI00103E4843|nr:hypothetical protein [Exiguobacterium sp. SH0S2]TCI63152.1 hypothetical protein EVJ21_06465 [Exiguobacterium sp. SH0S2]
MDLFEAIKEKDILLIRRRLSTYIMANPNDKNAVISRALTMIEQENIPLWDKDDTFERKDKKYWNQEYLTEAYASLKTEYYSRALFLHIVELGRHLSPVKETNQSSNRQTHRVRNGSIESHLHQLHQELNNLDNIRRRKGFNKQEKKRFDEIRQELNQIQSNHRSTESSKRSPLVELIAELYKIVRQILNASKGR